MKANWFNRNKRIKKRREILGERYTSNLTTRKFMSKFLEALNSTRDFKEIEYIYEICWCGTKDKELTRLKELINSSQFVQISEMTGSGIEGSQYDLNDISFGETLAIYIFKLKNETMLAKIISNTDSINGKDEIKFEQEVEKFDIQCLEQRKLIYPI